MIVYYNFKADVVDLLEKVSFKWQDIIEGIRVYTVGGEHLTLNGSSVDWSVFPLFPSCQQIDLIGSL